MKGVPFLWTLEHLWHDWLVTVNGGLLAVFVCDGHVLCADARAPRGAATRDAPEVAAGAAPTGLFPVPRSQGGVGMVCLALMIAGVFVDPMLQAEPRRICPHLPYGSDVPGRWWRWRRTLLSPREYYTANEFTFFPVKEVGAAVRGHLCMTMVPALGYLALPTGDEHRG
jgi:hypothetical protein